MYKIYSIIIIFGLFLSFFGSMSAIKARDMIEGYNGRTFTIINQDINK